MTNKTMKSFSNVVLISLILVRGWGYIRKVLEKQFAMLSDHHFYKNENITIAECMVVLSKTQSRLKEKVLIGSEIHAIVFSKIKKGSP